MNKLQKYIKLTTLSAMTNFGKNRNQRNIRQDTTINVEYQNWKSTGERKKKSTRNRT